MTPKKITSFEEACKERGLDPVKVLPDVSGMPESMQKTVTAYAMLCIIQSVLNGDWKPDWNNTSEYKYYPWFDVEEDDTVPSGFRLSCVGYGCGLSAASLGSRLYYRDADTAEFAGRTFIELYNDLILEPKS